MNKNILFFLFFFPFVLSAQITAEQQAELKALNNYINFTNTSIHGLLTIHGLAEMYNQEVNKYVDLESQKLNDYGNSDLPADIFDDPEHWFYPVSPYQWYDKALEGSKKLPGGVARQLNGEMDKMKSILTRANAIRFEIEHLTKQDDLKERKNLSTIYKKMEEVVALFNNFYTSKKQLKNIAKRHFLTLNLPDDNKKVTNLIAIHENVRAFLEGVRSEDDTNLIALVQHLKNNIATANDFKVADPNYQNVLKKATSLSKTAQNYLDNVPCPENHKLYGDTYYYYKSILGNFNLYGSGVAWSLNNWISENEYPVLLQLEEPHIFKVIYPKREIPKVAEVATIKPNKVPQTLGEREVVIKQNKIVVSPGTITIEIYDHQLQDGDIVSLNYNGHWILENYPLRRRPKKLTLPLKATNDNYLILHAVNMGNEPPNTATLSYIYNGERKSIVMESNMNESEMIQINIKE